MAHSTWVSQHLERWRALADGCLPSPKLPLNWLPWQGAERARVSASGVGSHRQGVELDYVPISPDFSLDRQPKGLRIKQFGNGISFQLNCNRGIHKQKATREDLEGNESQVARTSFFRSAVLLNESFRRFQTYKLQAADPKTGSALPSTGRLPFCVRASPAVLDPACCQPPHAVRTET